LYIDQFCARLNAGLSAVAVVLAAIVIVQLTLHTGAMLDDDQQWLFAAEGYALPILDAGQPAGKQPRVIARTEYRPASFR
jgi:hypothetical protein